VNGSGGSAYGAATQKAAVFDRSGRTRLTVTGRAPARMLNGILTGTMPEAPAAVATGVLGGRATYHTVLTPKGKTITDLWCVRRGDEEGDGFLLDVPERGREGLAGHLGKFLPPRLARAEDVSSSTASLAVVGPAAAALLSRLALGLRVDAAELSALEEGCWRVAGSSVPDGVVVMRSLDVWPEAFVVTGPAGSVEALRGTLMAAGAAPGDVEAWTTLRVEAERPEYGIDMGEDTIPVEAGIHLRAIDYGKGCYTGQEVIVRIRDRGHVNRSLRLLMLGDAPPPAPGTELFVAGADKPVGSVTSAVRSPRFGQTIALAYVRRGVEGDPVPG
jgi:folate-binding protein YgfZ